MPIPVAMTSVDRLFAHAERATALLDRCRATNGVAETERVAARWESGAPSTPAFRYPPRPDLTSLLAALEAVIDLGEGEGPWAPLYGARALELHREASTVDALDTAAFRERAAARFPVDRTPFGALADASARDWIRHREEPESESVPADEPRHPESLLSLVNALVGELRLPFRVLVSRDLASAAATGEGFIVVRSGVSHPPQRARRIALHEVYGHALPRVRAREESFGLFATGTAVGTDDEEGRAVLVEHRHGLADAARRRELAMRHLAALAVRAGADWVETVRVLVDHGVAPRRAVTVCARVHRGGGLAREIVYLPAYHRVRTAFEQEPALETWLERGRISVAAARTLRTLGDPPAFLLARVPAVAE